MAMLLRTTPARTDVWRKVFAENGVPLYCSVDEVPDLAEIRYLACWIPPEDLSVFPNLEIVLSVGAGVDQMQGLPDGVKLCRTVAPSIEEKVRDWVLMAVLMLYRDMPGYLASACQGDWASKPVPLARHGRVGIMGMGRIGRLVACVLADLGFQVSGWSRSGTAVSGVQMFGAEDRAAFLGQSDVLICLLPLTKDTEGVLNKGLFADLPRGAHLVHAGRGAQLDMTALQTALDEGQIASAMLDVTNPEPLPQGHWAWADPRVVVTPHVAADTDNVEGAEHALDVIRAAENGTALPGFVDRVQGY